MSHADADEGWTSIVYVSRQGQAVWQGEWRDTKTGEPVDGVKAIKLGTIWIWKL